MLLINVSSTFGAEIPYSKATKKNIRACTAMGAVEGGLAYAFFCYLNGARDWEDYKNHSVALAISGCVGALIGNFFAHCMSPEATLVNVENQINTILKHRYFSVLSLNDSTITESIERGLFREKFPLAAAFIYYGTCTARLEKCKDDLISVLKTGNQELEGSIILLLEKIELLYPILQHACISIRDDADFLNQCSALNIEDMKHAQEVAAQAALLGALNRSVIIYN